MPEEPHVNATKGLALDPLRHSHSVELLNTGNDLKGGNILYMTVQCNIYSVISLIAIYYICI
jgi:hypothetical protein